MKNSPPDLHHFNPWNELIWARSGKWEMNFWVHRGTFVAFVNYKDEAPFDTFTNKSKMHRIKHEGTAVLPQYWG